MKTITFVPTSFVSEEFVDVMRRQYILAAEPSTQSTQSAVMVSHIVPADEIRRAILMADIPLDQVTLQSTDLFGVKTFAIGIEFGLPELDVRSVKMVEVY